MRRTTFSLAALAFVAIAPVASAQGTQSAASKLTFGINSGTTTIDASDDIAKTKMGIGYGVSAGYDIMPALRLTAGVDMAKVDIDEEGATGDIGLTQLDFGARYSFLNVSPKFTPFLNASLTRRSFGADMPLGEEEVEVVFSGMGYTFGGGADYTLSPKLAITGGIKYTMGSFGKVEVDGESEDLDEDIDANGMRVNVGLTWRPFR